MCRNLASATLVVFAAASAANAQTVVARLDSISPYRTMELSTDGGDHYRDVRTGVNNFTAIGDQSVLPSEFRAFCIDLNQTITFNEVITYTVTALEDAPIPGDGMGLARANLVRELWGRYYFTSLTSDTNGAAFQAAVWEIIRDPGISLHSGSLRIEGHNETENLAQSWLNSLNGDQAHFAPVYALTSDCSQDMLVPAPGAAALFALGGILVSRRRR